MEESGLWSAWCPTCPQEQTEWPCSVVVLATWGLGWEPVVVAAATGEGCGAVTHRTGAPAEAARGL